MRLIFTTILFFIFQSSNAQFQLPKFEYDDVQILSEEDNVYQKVFKKGGETVLEVNYPHKNRIQSLCYKSSVVADSVYIFYAPVLKEISFRQRSGEITVRYCEKKSNLVTFETWFPNGKLKEKYSAIAQMDLRDCFKTSNLASAPPYPPQGGTKASLLAQLNKFAGSRPPLRGVGG